MHSDHPSSTQPVLTIDSDGTGVAIQVSVENGSGVSVDNSGTKNGYFLSQTGVLASGSHALYVYSAGAQVNGNLHNLHMDNPSSSSDVMYIDNDGTGSAISIRQDGVSASGKQMFYMWTDADQDNAQMVRWVMDNASSSQPVLRIDNDGTGASIVLTGGAWTEKLEIFDAGSTSATEQDWIEVEVEGVTGYIRVYASK
jgi:hypothetical protein